MVNSAAAMNGDQIIRLKQAGVSDETLQLMIEEKSIETASLTVDEVLDMKAAGIEEETLQTLIKSLSFMHNNQKKVYEVKPKGLQVGSTGDLLALKEAGFSEETIRAIITVTSVDKNQQAYADALRVLDNTGIWVTPYHRLPRNQHRPVLPSPDIRPE
jgi:hypothetical protein